MPEERMKGRKQNASILDSVTHELGAFKKDLGAGLNPGSTLRPTRGGAHETPVSPERPPLVEDHPTR